MYVYSPLSHKTPSFSSTSLSSMGCTKYTFNIMNHVNYYFNTHTSCMNMYTLGALKYKGLKFKPTIL